MKKIIEVNNGCSIEMEDNYGCVKIIHKDENGTITDRELFYDGEIVMVMNLLRHMKENNLHTAYLFNQDTARYLDNLLRYGDIEDFRIFQ